MNEMMVADYTIDSPVIYTPRLLYGVETIVEVQRGKLPSIIEYIDTAEEESSLITLEMLS